MTKAEVGDVDFLTKIPNEFEVERETLLASGERKITGSLGGLLRMTINRHQISLWEGSLCKWYMGDNYKVMKRKHVQGAFEKLSDTFKMPFERAIITRLDVANNIITQYPVDAYYSHFGEWGLATKMPYLRGKNKANGLLYVKTDEQFCIYDKTKESKWHKEPVPDLYQGRNVMRLEQRYMGQSHLREQLNVEEVTAKTLFDETTYIRLLELWKQAYLDIRKLNDITLNFSYMNSIKRLHRMGVLSLVAMVGGEMAILTQISDAQKRGELTKKQAYDLRATIKDYCQATEGMTTPSDAIQELTQKVKQAVAYRR
ncbi:MAG: hypothetical protein LIP09_07375 [Bacteroidales bacterium]|nr:hypothetical protein [Bacteroidales bacterium]